MKSSIDTALMALRDRMYRYARSILGSAPEAEDATHDTLERLLTRRDELGIYRNLDAFALTALRNRCIDRLRTKHTTERPSEALVGTTDEVERPRSRVRKRKRTTAPEIKRSAKIKTASRKSFFRFSTHGHTDVDPLLLCSGASDPFVC